jgi:hypothetical protein
MGHLAAGVDSCVGSTGAGDHRGFREPQYGLEGFFNGFLHSPEGGLTGPAVEFRPVIPQVNTPPPKPIMHKAI